MSYSPNNEVIVGKQADLESIEGELRRAKMSVAKVEELWAELNRLFAQYKLIEELLPDERNVPDFINKIYLAAKQADTDVKKIDQQPTQPLGYFMSDPYKIDISTTFHGMGKFLSLVANLPFTALVKELKISLSGSKKYSVSASLTVIAHHMETAQRPRNIQELKIKKVQPKEEKKPKKKGEYKPS